MAKCLLAIDIGNTSAKIGLYSGGRLMDFTQCSNDAVPNKVKKIALSGTIGMIDIIICSVVPKITKLFRAVLSRKKNVSLWIIGSNIKCPINHKYNKIRTLGSDRLVNIYGAIRLYRKPILLMGFGTALTADYIDARGTHLGGLIIPGPETAYRALLAKAALLPKGLPFPKHEKAFPGKTTRQCLKAGILQGYGAMADGLIDRFKSKYGKKLRVLATGGLAKIIAPYTHGIDIIDPLHSLKSLMVLWRESHKSG